MLCCYPSDAAKHLGQIRASILAGIGAQLFYAPAITDSSMATRRPKGERRLPFALACRIFPIYNGDSLKEITDRGATKLPYDAKEFAWHADALAHLEKGGSARDAGYPKIFNDTPMAGTYLYRPSKAEAPKAIILWYSTKVEGKLLCRINNEDVKYGLDIWPKVAGHPISRAVYDAFLETRQWPEEVLVTLPDGTSDSSMVRSPGIGDNSGGKLATHKGNIEEWMERAKKAIKKGAPTTQQDADALTDIKTKLLDLERDADADRYAETNPLFKVYKEKNEAWSSFITPVKPVTASLQALINAFVKAESARREAEAAAINAAAAAKAVDLDVGRGARPAEAPAPAPTVQAVPVTVGTRRVMRTAKKKIVKFSNIVETATFFAKMDPVPPDILKALTDKAMVLLSAGLAVPGATLDEETVGR